MLHLVKKKKIGKDPPHTHTLHLLPLTRQTHIRTQSPSEPFALGNTRREFWSGDGGRKPVCLLSAFLLRGSLIQLCPGAGAWHAYIRLCLLNLEGDSACQRPGIRLHGFRCQNTFLCFLELGSLWDCSALRLSSMLQVAPSANYLGPRERNSFLSTSLIPSFLCLRGKSQSLLKADTNLTS